MKGYKSCSPPSENEKCNAEEAIVTADCSACIEDSDKTGSNLGIWGTSRRLCQAGALTLKVAAIVGK